MYRLLKNYYAQTRFFASFCLASATLATFFNNLLKRQSMPCLFLCRLSPAAITASHGLPFLTWITAPLMHRHQGPHDDSQVGLAAEFRVSFL
jgi:hypothetical protein